MLILPNSIFIHLMKAGGTWTHDALRDVFPGEQSQQLIQCTVHTSLTYDIPGALNCDFTPRHPPECLANWFNPDELRKRTVFFFVRHPLSWHTSRWHYHRRVTKEPVPPLNDEVMRLLETSCDRYGMGPLSHMTKSYLDDVLAFGCKLRVGYAESLTLHLHEIVRDLEGVRSNAFFTRLQQNPTDEQKEKLTAQTEKAILDAEQWIHGAFYQTAAGSVQQFSPWRPTRGKEKEESGSREVHSTEASPVQDTEGH